MKSYKLINLIMISAGRMTNMFSTKENRNRDRKGSSEKSLKDKKRLSIPEEILSKDKIRKFREIKQHTKK
jgi:hypothetical protein